MRKAIIVASLLLAVIAVSAAPFVASAQTISFINIWQNTSCAPNPSIGPTASCTLCDGIVVARNIITNLFMAASIVAAVAIIAGAVVLMTAGASEKNVGRGKEIMLNAVLGLVIALAAWLVLNTFLGFLTGNTSLPWSTINCAETNIVPPPIASQSSSTASTGTNGTTGSGDNTAQIQQAKDNGCSMYVATCAQKSAETSSDTGVPTVTFEPAYQIVCKKNGKGGYDANFTFGCAAPVTSPWLKCSDPLPDLATLCSGN